MKFVGSYIAVLNNTNRVIGSSDSDWSGIRNGDLIQIGSNPNFYTILSVNDCLFHSDFEVLSSNTIKLKNNSKINILELDNIVLNYNEYELFTIFKLINRGCGYQVGDIVTVRGGFPKIDHSIDKRDQTLLKITDVNDKGEVQFLTIENEGHYISPPDKIGYTDGGHGDGLAIELDYSKIEKIYSIEREVSKIYEDGRIVLSVPLIAGLKEGFIDIKKWELNLNIPYIGENLYHSRYDIIRDFTPHLRLPLSTNNLTALQLSYNKAISILDSKIKELDDKLSLPR
jgi:hypothetical protein